MVDKGTGLTFWMDTVLSECARAGSGFDPDAVHDLRVALRRCRSIADGFMVFDSDRAWRDMKRASRKLFRELGNLRDIHVMSAWVQRLSGHSDGAAAILSAHLARQEQMQKDEALASLAGFDAAQWSSWRDSLALRSGRIPAGNQVFQHLALERWRDARLLHRTALRNRSAVAFHNLRIGLKRFRYTVENFLPDRLDEWGGDLREVQDLLGESHDLFILWRTALRIGAFRGAGLRSRWRAIIARERNQRLQRYRNKMCGPDSAWRIWRAGLPAGEEVRALAVARLGMWAQYHDPDCDHSRHVAELAGQILAGLASHKRSAGPDSAEMEAMIEAAALLHDVGRLVAAKDHHRISARMIRRLEPPLGFDADQMRRIALIARYHRGAAPRSSHGRFMAFTERDRRLITFLAGILRLANAFDLAHNGRIRKLELEQRPHSILIRARGYLEQDPLAQSLACARSLLEVSCQMPVWVEKA